MLTQIFGHGGSDEKRKEGVDERKLEEDIKKERRRPHTTDSTSKKTIKNMAKLY